MFHSINLDFHFREKSCHKKPMEHTTAYARKHDETIAKWLERLIGMNASADKISAVESLLKAEIKKYDSRGVAIPLSEFEPIPEAGRATVPAALARYKEIARDLFSSPEIRHILVELQDMSRSSNVTEFLFLNGSSGMGKTQTALTIRELILAENRPVFYMLAEPISENFQDIYKAFGDISEVFLACVNADVNYLGATIEGFNSWNTVELYTYGFINAIFRKFQRSSEVISEVSPCRKSQVFDGVDKTAYASAVIILDELTAELNPSLARFKRNVFRSLNLVVIALGTDARIVNLIRGVGVSRSADLSEVTPWCNVVYCLPEVNLHSFPLPFEPPEFLPWILAHSRPLFSKLAVDYLTVHQRDVGAWSAPELLDRLAGYVAEESCRRKGVFQSHNKRTAQLCLLGNTSYSSGFEAAFEGSRGHVAVFIHQHFANLFVSADMDPHGGGSFKVLTDQTVAGKLFNNPKSCFPSPSEDVLLHLALLGGRHFNPVRNSDADEGGSVYEFIMSILATRTYENHFSESNANQASSSGMRWEFFCAACMCVASRLRGVSGSAVHQFIASLLHQLTGRRFNVAQLLGAIPHLADRQVPFACAPNQTWPDALTRVPNTCFGHIQRARNVDKVDIKLEPVLADTMEIDSEGTVDCITVTGECKDLVDKVPLADVNRSITNVPPNSRLHIIFGNSFSRHRHGQLVNAMANGGSAITYLCSLVGGPGGESLTVECLSQILDTETEPQCVVLLLPLGPWNLFR